MTVLHRRGPTARVAALLALALLASPALAACGDRSASTGSAPDEAGGDPEPGGADLGALDGRRFAAVRVEDPAHRPVRGTTIRLAFTGGTLSANAGCNTMSGEASLDGDVLRIAGLAGTEMGCDEDRSAQDAWLVDLLSAGPTVGLDNERLTLTTQTATVVLMDEAAQASDSPALADVWWRLTALVSGDGPDATVSTPPRGSKARVRLHEGRLLVETGCNKGSAEAEESAGALTLGPLALTRMACRGDLMRLEQDVVAVLDSRRLAVLLADGRLTLTAPGGAALVFSVAG